MDMVIAMESLLVLSSHARQSSRDDCHQVHEAVCKALHGLVSRCYSVMMFQGRGEHRSLLTWS